MFVGLIKLSTTKPYLMKEQNFSNHTRLVPLYHYVAATILLGLLIGASINLYYNWKLNTYESSLIFGLTILLALVWFFSRFFALKAQDRAIRAEENFRHFILTGKPLNTALRLGQIIALRFASDDEFIALAEKAVAEKLSSKQIKQSIRNWKADYHRV